MNFLLLFCLTLLLSNNNTETVTTDIFSDHPEFNCYLAGPGYVVDSDMTLEGTKWVQDYTLSRLAPAGSTQNWSFGVCCASTVTFINGTSASSISPQVRFKGCSGFTAYVTITCPNGSTLSKSVNVDEVIPCT